MPHSAPVCERRAGDSGLWVPWGLQTGSRDISASIGPADGKQTGGYTGMRPVRHGALVPWGPALPQYPLLNPLDYYTLFLHSSPFSSLLWKLSKSWLGPISSADEIFGVGLLVLDFYSSYELGQGRLIHHGCSWWAWRHSFPLCLGRKLPVAVGLGCS